LLTNALEVVDVDFTGLIYLFDQCDVKPKSPQSDDE
jgi:hypothetical protein